MCMRGYNLYTTCKFPYYSVPIICFCESISFEDGVTHTLDTISSSYYRVVASDANLVLITMVCNSYYMVQKFYLGKFTL